MTAFSKWLPPSARAIHGHVAAASIQGLEKAIRPYSVVAVKTLSDVSKNVPPRKKKTSFTSKLETIFEGKAPSKYWAPSSCAAEARDIESDVSDLSGDEIESDAQPVIPVPPKTSLLARYGGVAKPGTVATNGNTSRHSEAQSALLRYSGRNVKPQATKPQVTKDPVTPKCSTECSSQLAYPQLSRIQLTAEESAQIEFEERKELSQGESSKSTSSGSTRSVSPGESLVLGDSSDDASSSEDEIELDFQEITVAGSGIKAAKALRS